MSHCVSICNRCGSASPRTLGSEFCPICATRAADNTTPSSSGSAALPPEPEVNETAGIIGHDVHEAIGIGGMGSVHRARQDNLQRDVALKIALPKRTSPEDRDRFLREARVLAQLDHPNIVPIYDFGRDDDGRCYYTMKMVRGRTLKAILTAVREGQETWTLERLLEVFRKVCDAVAFAHARGVIHRDLKPANIMVGEFGEVLVVDWGLAGHIKTVIECPQPHEANGANGKNGRNGKNGKGPHDSSVTLRPVIESTAELTMAGEVVGTPQYMSPEQADACTDLDARCDIYALGGILYTILTLRPPLPKTKLETMLENVRSGNIEPFAPASDPVTSSAAPWRIPPALTAVVRKAMALQREDRFQSVTAFAADVDAHVAGFATTAEQISFAGLFWLFIKRHLTVSIAIGVLLLISAGFVIRLVASERRANYSAWVAGQKAAVARNAEDDARRAERAAQEDEARANKALAQTQIAFADSAYAAGDTKQMRILLDSVPEDLRDTNWNYLNGRTDDREALLIWGYEGFLVGSTPHPTQPGVFTAATSADHHRIVDYDAKTGKVLREFSHRGDWVRGVAYSPDGSLLALSRISGAGVSIHRASDGEELIFWKSGWADSVEFLPDNRRLLQSDHHGCHLWDATNGNRIWKSELGMTHLLLPGGTRIVAVDEAKVSILSAEDGHVLSTFPIKSCTPITSSLSPDGETLIVAHQDGQIGAFHVADGTRIYETPAGDNGSIIRTIFTRDGRHLITVANLLESVQSVQFRDAATGRSLRALRGGAGGVESICIHPLSGDLLITSANSATWVLPKIREPRWRVARGNFDNGYIGGTIGGFLDGDDLFLGPASNAPIAVVNVVSGEAVWQPKEAGTNSAYASADGRLGIIQAGRNGPRRDFAVLRAGADGIQQVATIDFGTDARSIAANCDLTRVAMSGSWGGVDAFRTEDGQRLGDLEQADIRSNWAMAWHGTDPARLIGIFVTDGRRGMPNAKDWLFAWDTNTGKRVRSVRSPTPTNCLAAEPGGTRLAEAGEDKIVRIRDADTLEVLSQFRAHDGPIQAIAWSPRGHVLATGSLDRSVRLWNTETGKLIEEVHIGLREPTSLYFSPSGKRLACATPGEKTLIWELK